MHDRPENPNIITQAEILRQIELSSSRAAEDDTALVKLLRFLRQRLRLELDLPERTLPQIRLLAEYIERRHSYCDGSSRLLFACVFGLTYLVTVMDLHPDFLPGGLIDDGTIINLIVSSVQGELEAFERWTRSQKPNH